MSDFLDSLLGRALGEGGTIRRYRPSRYEPTADPLPPPMPIEPLMAPMGPNEQPAMPPPPPTMGATSYAAPAAVTHVMPSETPTPTLPAPRMVAPPIATIQREVTHHETRIERETRRIDTIIERTPAERSVTFVTTTVNEAPTPRLEPLEPDRSRPVPAAPVQPTAVAPTPTARVPQVPPAWPDPPRRSSPASVPSLPAVVRIAQAPTPPPARLEPPAPAPIEITIGRLEIRATPVSPQTARPRPARGPALGLDAYLRQRGGGTP